MGGLDQRLVRVSWLGGLVPVFQWMELDFVSLRGSGVSGSVSGGVYGFGMALGSQSSNVQSCAPVLLKNGVWNPSLDLAGLSVGFGLSVETEAFGRAPIN